ncbi:hypothetical protein QQZ08_007047 [Neonectria magnoliae]|uniref:Uncharacterized protein n=1 Tax=Neonectria magnoliae TaxID=2732573 RepID=A0ABR1I0C1_9HYPO
MHMHNLAQNMPDLVRDWELDSNVVGDDYTIQTSYVSDPVKDLWPTRIEEKWEDLVAMAVTRMVPSVSSIAPKAHVLANTKP